MITEQRYFTVSEVAKAIEKSAQTVKRWAKVGKIPRGSKVKANGRIVFTLQEFELIKAYATEVVEI
jgi:predicted site-specific integrase-resolvase